VVALYTAAMGTEMASAVCMAASAGPMAAVKPLGEVAAVSASCGEQDGDGGSSAQPSRIVMRGLCVTTTS
jgi:hypothetical protein